MNSLQLEFDLVEHVESKVHYEPDTFVVGEYAIVSEICADGYYLWERCYVHEVLPDGYRVEICEGIFWGRPWCKDGSMITVSRTGLSKYYPDITYGQGAHFVPTIEFFLRNPSYVYDTHSTLV